MRKPLKTDALKKIIEIGMPVETVVDVGILTGTSELMTVYKHCKQLLIEPIVEWNEAIIKNYSKLGIDFDLVNVAAAEKDGKMALELSSIKKDTSITHARLSENPTGGRIREVEVRSVASLVKEKALKGPYLVKIDVDGAELRVLEGVKDIADEVSVIIIEVQVRNFLDRMNAVCKLGFQLFDIVDICYYSGRLNQMDLVFLNDSLVEKYKLDMFSNTFDYNLWETFKP
ncbi:FkbM family methyltransferase [Szabonella alba]|uniref:FkbM family methyltransferase n=1 Tax=Szabonella alba TaxID=2804194 RepID=A0A8K0VGG9_9RHOB|nr:FkbM family methyltransferase [Szabonella alba]MBL4919355.1 FkbM family methyltransferase [Szabonella alba]